MFQWIASKYCFIGLGYEEALWTKKIGEKGMPVKFWHTSLRFWFLLSYLITTVSFSIMICFEIMYWNEVACDLHSNKIYVSCITLYYVFKRSKLKIPSYFIYENNKYFYCHNSWNATTCIWCNKLEVDKKQYINEKKSNCLQDFLTVLSDRHTLKCIMF